MTIFEKLDPSTSSEALLARLCEHSFLSLWSYPRIHHDQSGQGGTTMGKEVCDLLVIFGDDILLFSDKSCAMRNTGNLELDWQRWYRRAVLAGAKQVLGAERWIKEHPDRLFLDPQCKQPFPIPLRRNGAYRFHRIVVARGAGIRCVKELGGSGSLMLDSTIIECGRPFTIGWVNAKRGYVHVLDDTTLFVLLETLDTITDFVGYLSKKEALLSSGRAVFAAGEEEVLADYLRDVGADGEHGFIVPRHVDSVAFPEGNWEAFRNHPQRRAQVAEDRISYFWDSLIERFAHHIVEGTSYFNSHSAFSDQETLLRALAAESRFRRRMLSQSVLDAAGRVPADQRLLRVFPPHRPSLPFYVFLFFPWRKDYTEEENRKARRHFLEAACMVTRLEYPAATRVAGIATEAGRGSQRSEDAILLDATEWTTELDQEARSLQRDLNLLTNVQHRRYSVQEYPSVALSSKSLGLGRGNKSQPSRNRPCPCGSGKKFKRCCGGRTH